MTDNKYKMFSNYMHNELDITKEDIHDWIKEAVQEIALRMCKNEFDKFDPSRIISNIIMSNDYYGSINLKAVVKEEIGKQLSNRITITLKEVSN